MLYLNVTIKHLFVKTCQVCVSVILMHSHEYSRNLVFERIKKKKQIITIIVITIIIIIKLDLMVACVGGACQRDSKIVLDMNG